MATHLFGAEALSEAMLSHGQLDPKEHIPVELYSKL